MRIVLFACLIASFLTSCSSENNSSASALEMAEKAVTSNPSDLEAAKALIMAYQGELKGIQGDTPEKATLLQKLGAELLRQKKAPAALPFLFDAAKKGKGSETGAKALESLAVAFSTYLNLPDYSAHIYSSIARDYPNFSNLESIKARTKVPSASMDSILTNLSGDFFNEKSGGSLNQLAIQNFLRGVKVNALTNPNEKAVEWLLTGGQTAQSIKDFDTALENFDWVLSDFPNHPKASQALFMKAFTYDDNLSKGEIAKGLYESFLQKYPNDPFAESAKFLLENLGTSNDKIIEKFEANRK